MGLAEPRKLVQVEAGVQVHALHDDGLAIADALHAAGPELSGLVGASAHHTVAQYTETSKVVRTEQAWNGHLEETAVESLPHNAALAQKLTHESPGVEVLPVPQRRWLQRPILRHPHQLRTTGFPCHRFTAFSEGRLKTRKQDAIRKRSCSQMAHLIDCICLQYIWHVQPGCQLLRQS